MKSGHVRFWVGLFGLVLAWRVLPYALHRWAGMPLDPATTWFPWNFSPMLAVCLFSGACLSDKRWAFTGPLAAFAASNFGMWAMMGDRLFAFSPSQPLIAATFLLTIGLGLFLQRSPNLLWAFPAAVAAECLFFVVSNFAVWFFGEGAIYPLSPGGLWMCYVAAIPFFGRSLTSTTLFCAVLFNPLAVRLAGAKPAPIGSFREALKAVV